jgi:hypothetical protein
LKNILSFIKVKNMELIGHIGFPNYGFTNFEHVGQQTHAFLAPVLRSPSNHPPLEYS